MSLALHTCAGEVLALPVKRWMSAPTAEEERLLDRAVGPVLDVGCGPGRLVLALAARGVTTLGVDSSPGAAALCRERGAPVLERSIFDRMPGTGRWGSALLLDGNAGIGGDPAVLLHRIGVLLRPGGRALVEVEPPGFPTGTRQARLAGDGPPGPWFPWARVGAGDAAALGAASGCRLVDLWEDHRRWFAHYETGACFGGSGVGAPRRRDEPPGEEP